jgi:hypothetical protein
MYAQGVYHALKRDPASYRILSYPYYGIHSYHVRNRSTSICSLNMAASSQLDGVRSYQPPPPSWLKSSSRTSAQSPRHVKLLAASQLASPRCVRSDELSPRMAALAASLGLPGLVPKSPRSCVSAGSAQSSRPTTAVPPPPQRDHRRPVTAATDVGGRVRQRTGDASPQPLAEGTLGIRDTPLTRAAKASWKPTLAGERTVWHAAWEADKKGERMAREDTMTGILNHVHTITPRLFTELNRVRERGAEKDRELEALKKKHADAEQVPLTSDAY